ATFDTRYRANGVSLVSHIPTNLPGVWADPERLGQVLTNLLDNALRHTHHEDHVVVAAHAINEAVVVTVSDTGDGVAPEHLIRLFDGFYRVDGARDREHGGAGIGLAIAKALVEAHGGQIHAHSDGIGSGCTFTFTVPRRCPPTVLSTASRAELDGT